MRSLSQLRKDLNSLTGKGSSFGSYKQSRSRRFLRGLGKAALYTGLTAGGAYIVYQGSRKYTRDYDKRGKRSNPVNKALELFGIPANTPPGNIGVNTKYKKLSLLYHPDKHRGKSEQEIIDSNKKFLQLKPAIDILNEAGYSFGTKNLRKTQIKQPQIKQPEIKQTKSKQPEIKQTKSKLNHNKIKNIFKTTGKKIWNNKFKILFLSSIGFGAYIAGREHGRIEKSFNNLSKSDQDNVKKCVKKFLEEGHKLYKNPEFLKLSKKERDDQIEHTLAKILNEYPGTLTNLNEEVIHYMKEYHPNVKLN